MKIHSINHGVITAGLFSRSKPKSNKRDKAYSYHKDITVISEEYVKTKDQEYRKRNVKHIVKDSKGQDKR